VLGATISALQGWIMARWFSEASVLVRSTVTIGMAISIFGVTVRIFHDTLRSFPILFKSVHIELGSVTVTGAVLASIVGAIGFAGILWLALARTRLGVILRAVSGRPTTAELMGVRTTRLIVLVWAVAGALTTAAILLVAPSRRTIPSLALLVVPGLAAAIVGAMKSFALTVVGGILIGTIESVALEWGTIGNYRPALSFVMVTLALLWSQRRETWSDAR
jgi:branched-chain amino acid transport system permease protein